MNGKTLEKSNIIIINHIAINPMQCKYSKLEENKSYL